MDSRTSSFYCQRIQQLQNPAVTVRFINSQKGKGLFALRDFQPGEIIFQEKPFIAQQHIGNRWKVTCCTHCFRFLGSPFPPQFYHLNHLISLYQQFQIEIPTEILSYTSHFSETFPKPNLFPCTGGCGELYCSIECRDLSFQLYHNFLCVGPIKEEDSTVHPLILFKQHAITVKYIVFIGCAVYFNHFKYLEK